MPLISNIEFHYYSDLMSTKTAWSNYGTAPASVIVRFLVPAQIVRRIEQLYGRNDHARVQQTDL